MIVSKRDAGFSLIEVLVAVGILGVVAMGSATVIANMSRENAALGEKLTALAAESDLIRLLQGSSMCGCLLQDSTLNSKTKIVHLANTSIPVSYDKTCTESSAKLISPNKPIAGSKLLVDSISMKEIKAGAAGTGQFQGELTVTIQSAGLVRTIKPLKVPISFYVDPTAPPASQKILGCGAAPSEDGPTLGTVATSGGNKGSLVVNLPAGRFKTPPIVMIQPKWARLSSGEGTTWWIDNVTTASFEINWKGPNSGDTKGDRFVNWMAFKSPD